MWVWAPIFWALVALLFMTAKIHCSYGSMRKSLFSMTHSLPIWLSAECICLLKLSACILAQFSLTTKKLLVLGLRKSTLDFLLLFVHSFRASYQTSFIAFNLKQSITISTFLSSLTFSSFPGFYSAKLKEQEITVAQKRLQLVPRFSLRCAPNLLLLSICEAGGRHTRQTVSQRLPLNKIYGR